MGLTRRQRLCRDEAQILAKELVLCGYDVRAEWGSIFLSATAGDRKAEVRMHYCSRWWYLYEQPPRMHHGWTKIATSGSWEGIVAELKAWLEIWA